MPVHPLAFETPERQQTTGTAQGIFAYTSGVHLESRNIIWPPVRKWIHGYSCSYWCLGSPPSANSGYGRPNAVQHRHKRMFVRPGLLEDNLRVQQYSSIRSTFTGKTTFFRLSSTQDDLQYYHRWHVQVCLVENVLRTRVSLCTQDHRCLCALTRVPYDYM